MLGMTYKIEDEADPHRVSIEFSWHYLLFLDDQTDYVKHIISYISDLEDDSNWEREAKYIDEMIDNIEKNIRCVVP